MAKTPNSTSPLALPSFFAKRIAPGKGGVAHQKNLAQAITDIQVQTQVTAGANLLTVTGSDPDLELVTSGFFACDDEGELEPVEVELDGVHYSLVDIQGTTDVTQPNITLEFQTRGASYLRKLKGPKKATRGAGSTRDEFIKARVDEVKAGGGIRL